MAHKRGESNNGSRDSSGRYGNCSWFNHNVKKRRRREQIAKASRRANRPKK